MIEMHHARFLADVEQVANFGFDLFNLPTWRASSIITIYWPSTEQHLMLRSNRRITKLS